MAQKTIKVTDEFVSAVEDYQKARKLESWTKALVELASIGIDRTAGFIPPMKGKWGGDHRSDRFRQQAASLVEHLDIELMGLPPLADDD